MAAREIAISHTVLHEFLHGKRPALKKNPGPAIRAWIATKRAKRGAAFKTRPMLKKLAGNGILIVEAAEALGLRPPVLYRALTTGEWPTREMAEAFEKYLAREKEGRKRMLSKADLTREILESYGFKRNPFPDELGGPEDIFENRNFASVVKAGERVITEGGWLVITGTTGTGKTVLLKKLRSKFAGRKDIVISQPQTLEKQHLGASGLCDALLEDLGATWSKGQRLELRARRVGEALRQAYAEGRRVILLIDEGHLLTDDSLLALKRFFEIEVGFKKLLSIVLIGQEELASRLSTNVKLAEVTQRCKIIEMAGLNGFFAQYLRFKLDLAGANGKEIFDSSALKAIHEKMGKAGRFFTPQSLNNLAGAALRTAWDLRQKTITGDIIRAIPGNF